MEEKEAGKRQKKQKIVDVKLREMRGGRVGGGWNEAARWNGQEEE